MHARSGSSTLGASVAETLAALAVDFVALMLIDGLAHPPLAEAEAAWVETIESDALMFTLLPAQNVMWPLLPLLLRFMLLGKTRNS